MVSIAAWMEFTEGLQSYTLICHKLSFLLQKKRKVYASYIINSCCVLVRKQLINFFNAIISKTRIKYCYIAMEDLCISKNE